jgi:hypothetical protein
MTLNLYGITAKLCYSENQGTKEKNFVITYFVISHFWVDEKFL